MRSRFSRRRIERGERGVALVEFALIFPIFMTLVLGMFSGGIAYNRQIAMTNAAREGARYGATLPPALLDPGPPSAGIDRWVTEVARAVQQNAEGHLQASAPGLRICVAYLYPDSDTDPTNIIPHRETSHMVIRTTTGDVSSASDDGSPPSPFQCFEDGRPDSERRVQVLVQRKSTINALFIDHDVTLSARSVTRFEATSF